MGARSRSQRQADVERERRRLRLDEEIGPVHIDVDDEPAEPEMELLFTIGDQEYFIPREVPAYLSIRYLNNVRKTDGVEAEAELLADLLGDEAMDALASCPQLKPEQLQTIMRKVAQKAMAAAADNVGN